MLKGIDPRMPAELLYVLMRMGHGDEIAVVDCNYPAHSAAMATVTGRALELAGLGAPEAIAMICSLLPLDTFAYHGAHWMQADGKGDAPEAVHREAADSLRRVAGQDISLGSLTRHDFYARAARGFAVVRTTEQRAFGCFILRKGVVF